MSTALPIPQEQVAAFCRRHHVRRMALYGSVLRSDFSPASDIDVLVEFDPAYMPGFSFFTLADELAAILGRRVDLNTPGSFRGPLRDHILSSAETVFDAA